MIDYQQVLQHDPSNHEAQRCSVLLKAVLTDDGNGCINSEMIQKALSGMMEKAAQRREQMLEVEKSKAESQGAAVTVGSDGGLVFEENEEQKAAREKILGYVSNLKAYFPHPSFPIFFIRTLEKMKLEPDSQWFPWGNPPISRMEEQLASLEDPAEIRPFAETLAALKDTQK